MTNTNKVSHKGLTVYIRHNTGAMHAFQGRRLEKLLTALRDGTGNEILTDLVMNGYEETMGGLSVDSLEYAPLLREARGQFAAD